MKVLFVRSGNKGQHPITQNQGEGLVDAGCEIHYFDVIGKGLFGYLGNLSKLRQMARVCQPDVIHAHYSLCGFLVSLTFLRKPIVVSLMGSDVITSSRRYRIVLRFFSLFFWDKVIVKSQEMYNLLRFRDAVIIPNGVSEKHFYPVNRNEARQKLGWEEGEKIALFASDPGRKEKNYTLFCQAIELINNKGVKVIEKHLFNLSKSEMNLYFNAADVLVLTSFHEGSPNVIKEAMFCNCPFISVNVGDVKSWTDMTRGNFLVDYSPSQIAQAMEETFDSNYCVDNNSVYELLSSNIISHSIKSIYSEII